MRRLFFVCLFIAACSSDRPRPDPTQSSDPAVLIAYVRKPFNNATVLGARPLAVEIQATDVSRDALIGLGYVVRKGGAKLDSVVVRFTARTDSTMDFDYLVPDYPTNTQIDIYALAFGAHGETKVSAPAMLVVVKCQAGLPGC